MVSCPLAYLIYPFDFEVVVLQRFKDLLDVVVAVGFDCYLKYNLV
jgi:hypothetical protein